MASRRSSCSLLVMVVLLLACLLHATSAAVGMPPRFLCAVRGGAQQPSAFQRLMSVRGGMQVRVYGGVVGEWSWEGEGWGKGRVGEGVEGREWRES